MSFKERMYIEYPAKIPIAGAPLTSSFLIAWYASSRLSIVLYSKTLGSSGVTNGSEVYLIIRLDY